jgi:hypothetical protein
MNHKGAKTQRGIGGIHHRDTEATENGMWVVRTASHSLCVRCVAVVHPFFPPVVVWLRCDCFHHGS